MDFHEIIYKATDNRRLMQILNNLREADVPLPDGIFKRQEMHPVPL